MTFQGYANENVDDFFLHFEANASLQKLDDGQKKAALGIHLAGPALIFYKSRYNTADSYTEISKWIKDEFPSAENPLKEFYTIVMMDHENVFEFMYKFLSIANNAGIKDDSQIVNRFIEAMPLPIREKLVLSNITNVATLKIIIKKLDTYNLFPRNVGKVKDAQCFDYMPQINKMASGDAPPVSATAPIAGPSQQRESYNLRPRRDNFRATYAPKPFFRKENLGKNFTARKSPQ